jgi:hypothetical protein
MKILENKVSTYDGVFALGFETFRFTPTGVKESWWIDYESVKAVGWDKIENTNCKKSKIPCKHQFRTIKKRAKGIVTSIGKYGHLGKYTRQIKFIEIY